MSTLQSIKVLKTLLVTLVALFEAAPDAARVPLDCYLLDSPAV